MDINEFLIQATLASIRGGRTGTLAVCDAIGAAKLLLVGTSQVFQNNINLINFKKINIVT